MALYHNGVFIQTVFRAPQAGHECFFTLLKKAAAAQIYIRVQPPF